MNKIVERNAIYFDYKRLNLRIIGKIIYPQMLIEVYGLYN